MCVPPEPGRGNGQQAAPCDRPPGLFGRAFSKQLVALLGQDGALKMRTHGLGGH